MPTYEETGALVPLSEMYGDIKALREDMTKLVTLHEKSQDHEQRIRDLEKNKAEALLAEKQEVRLDAMEKKMWTAAGALTVLAIAFPNIGEFAKMIGG